MDAALKELLKQTVTFEPYTGRNSYGKETYGAAVPQPARVTEELVMVRQPDGSEKLAKTLVRLDGNAVVDSRDRITLPDGTHPAILSVARFPDESGTNYTVKVRTE